ncbi:MAG: hypothetical protein V1836_04170 [Candidatus Aenigmatarchaeota archaeon]
MGRLSSLLRSAEVLDDHLKRNDRSDYEKRYKKTEASFDALRKDMLGGGYSTGNKTRDFCFLAECSSFDMIAGIKHPEYAECATYINEFRYRLGSYIGALALYEDEKTGISYCGRIRNPPLRIDIPNMIAEINAGKLIALNSSGKWRKEGKNIPVIDIARYDDFDVVDLTSELDQVVLGNAEVEERLGSDYNLVRDLITPIARQQIRMAL